MSAERPHVVLIGPPRVGVSTVGALVASRLEMTFVDTNDEVEKTANKVVSEIFVDSGEDYFRALELETVHRVLAESNAVIALGSGAVMNPLVEDLLRDHWVVFLNASVSGIAERAGFDMPRPQGLLSPRAQWRQLMALRQPVYERVASLMVDTDALNAHQAAEFVVAWWTERNV